MTNKLTRARHIRRQTEAQTSQASQACSDENRSKHNGGGKTIAARTPNETEPDLARGDARSIGHSAALMSACVIISRITGFGRTWAMAFALGSTLLSSSYQVANNLPNMLYELVAGGMLVTAFLPVYVSIKNKLGTKASNEYASNLLSIVIIFLGIVSLLCMIFPSVVIYTQSFMSDQSTMTTAVFLFQFFAIQIVFYGVSSIVSGLLNANRDYLMSNLAPVANNLIVIITFIAYAFVAPHDGTLALYIIAIGNPLGVFVQMAVQIPMLRRNGIHISPRINFRDPALRETISLGLPAMFVMLCAFIIVSAQNGAALYFADNGPSIIAYSRLWYTLPYSIFAVPITTAMFTELATMQSGGDLQGVKRGIISGTNQILFFMIPFALYLIVFSRALITLYCAGEFTEDNIEAIAVFLAVLAVSLPFYAINTYLQKVFSSLRRMKVFALIYFIACVIQVFLTVGAALLAWWGLPVPIESIAIGTLAFQLVADCGLFLYLRREFGALGLRATANVFGIALLLGGLGAAAGGGLLWAAETFIAPLSASIFQAFVYVIVCGLVSLAVTFGLALKFKIPEAAFLTNAIARMLAQLSDRTQRSTENEEPAQRRKK